SDDVISVLPFDPDRSARAIRDEVGRACGPRNAAIISASHRRPHRRVCGGAGECMVRGWPRLTATIVEDLLAPLLVGRAPRDVGRLWDEMFAQLRRWGHSRGVVLEAMSGVDIALWDLVAQSSGEPLSRALRR